MVQKLFKSMEIW